MTVSIPNTYRPPDFDHPSEQRHRRQLAESVDVLLKGGSNAVFDVTLDPSPAETTTVQNDNIKPISRVQISGANAAAINDLASGTCYVLQSEITTGQMIIRHVPYALERKVLVALIG